MKKLYTWGEITNFLRKELEKSKHIMTFGTIGSCNIEHDIDVIITKFPDSKSSDFYREIHVLFEGLDIFLKTNYKSKVIRHYAPSLEFLKMSDHKENDLIIHSMVYTSYNQIEGDWNWALFPNENLNEIIKSINLIKGKINDLSSKEFAKKKFYDSMFIFLSMYDKINSNYREENLVMIMKEYYDYLFGKRLKMQVPEIKNRTDVKKAFYKLCDEIDRLEKKKN